MLKFVIQTRKLLEGIIKKNYFYKTPGFTVILPVLTSNLWKQWLHEGGWHVLGYSICHV